MSKKEKHLILSIFQVLKLVEKNTVNVGSLLNLTSRTYNILQKHIFYVQIEENLNNFKHLNSIKHVTCTSTFSTVCQVDYEKDKQVKNFKFYHYET